MAFWSDTTLDPKRAFKFKVTFGAGVGTGAADNTFIAQSADRPQYTISDTATVDFLDKKFYFPGKITWEPVKIKFVDGVDASVNVSKKSYNFLGNAGWISPANIAPASLTVGNFSTISKSSATAQTGLVLVQVLDSRGVAVDSWQLHNAFITKVTLNGLAYTSEDILTAEYTLRYDWATLT